jgi:Circadian oscillating protein COP23
MKLKLAQALLLSTIVPTIIFSTQIVRSQLPPVVDNSISDEIEEEVPSHTAGSSLRVSCQNLKTVVQKGDRQATLLSWNYNGFGREYTPTKRCQVVSERLQQAVNQNGGTFKNLQLASGKVNTLPVICAMPANQSKCDRQNMLFTLNPENAANPETIMRKIFKFAQDGNSSIEESASIRPKLDNNLGNWERKVFKKSRNVTKFKQNDRDTGF